LSYTDVTVGSLLVVVLAFGLLLFSIIQGTGYATMEERLLDRRTGLHANADLESYHLPTIMDVPQMETLFVDRADPLVNNLGAKGLGEPPIGLDSLSRRGDAWHVGALVTLSRLAGNARFGRKLAVLAEASRESASPQLRHRATLGGNLLQRPRCWYFRIPWYTAGSRAGSTALPWMARISAMLYLEPGRATSPRPKAGSSTPNNSFRG
jgi:hypothetical protein